MSERKADTERFYELMGELEEQVGGKRKLSECRWNMGWPMRGVYFFFEDGETRATSNSDLRVVRVGTHAVTVRSKSRLWHRLYEHKQDGGRSVFRDHLNRALKARSNAGRRSAEHNHSRCISTYIGNMPFLWINVDGESSHNQRKSIERNAIALLSNWRRDPIDRQSDNWLGHQAQREEIGGSGLWNVQHTKRNYKREFLKVLQDCISQTEKLVDPPTNWDQPACLNVTKGD